MLYEATNTTTFVALSFSRSRQQFQQIMKCWVERKAIIFALLTYETFIHFYYINLFFHHLKNILHDCRK